jgi:ribonuclease P protein component
MPTNDRLALQGPPMTSPRPELWRVTDRRTFRALREQGHRARRGPLVVTFLAPAPGEDIPPRAAFAVGRTVGGAVQRNRIRRRLRAALRELRSTGRLPSGTYLVGGQSELADLPWADLVELLDVTITEARS